MQAWLALLSAASLSAQACQCMGWITWSGEPDPTPEERAAETVRDAELIFTGTVKGIETSLLDRRRAKSTHYGIAIFEVERVWKGAEQPEVRVQFSASGAACGRLFAVGERLTILAHPVSAWNPYGRGYGSGYCDQLVIERNEPAIRGQLSRYEEESRRHRELLEKHPADLAAWESYAATQRRWSDWARLEQTYRRMVELAPTNFQAALGHARALYQVGRVSESLDDVAVLLGKEPAILEARQLRLQALLKVSREVTDRSLRDFRSLAFNGAHFDRWDLGGADFRSANLTRVGFLDAQLDGARFDGATAESCSFDGSSLRRASFSNFKARHVSFRRADLRGASFDGANLLLANLSGARYSDSTKWPAGFDPNVRGAVRVDE